MAQMTGRPILQDLVKAAMVDSAARVRVSNEAHRQSVKTASEKEDDDEKCKKCGKEKCSCGGKMAAASAQHVEKLAGALDFLADMLLKEGTNLAGPHNLTEHLQTSAPGVLEARSSTPLPDHKGEGVHTVPMHPGQQKAMKAEHGGTQMENTQDHAPELHKEQIQTNYGKKSASVLDLVRAKLASDEHEKKETEGLREADKGLKKVEKAHFSEPENKVEKEEKKEGSALSLADYMRAKVAEDAINPAKITAGPAVPPETSAAGEPGGHPVGGAPQGPRHLVDSAEAAIKATKGETHGVRRADLKQYFNEPALSSAHDNVLQVAFDNTGKAGPKIASAAPPASASVKTAAARVLLSKLAESAEQNNTGT